MNNTKKKNLKKLQESGIGSTKFPGSFFLICCIFLNLIFSQQEQKPDTEKFLENIRQILKKVITTQSLYGKQKRKMRNLQLKTKIKKKIMEKFTNPYTRFNKKLPIIEYKHKLSSSPEKNSLSTLPAKDTGINKFTNSQISKSIERVLRQSSTLLPFNLGSLEKFKSQISKFKADKKENNIATGIPSITSPSNFTAELILWLEDIMVQIRWFWELFSYVFDSSASRRNFLMSVLCSTEPNEVRVNPELSSLNTNKEYLYPLTFNPLYNKSLISAYEYCPNRKGMPHFEVNNSLCLNLQKLDFLGFCWLKKIYEKVAQCLPTPDNCPGINLTLKNFYFLLRKYMKFAEEILKKQLLPLIYTTCCNEGLCEDIGIKCGVKYASLEKTSSNDMTFFLYNLVTKKKVDEINYLYNFYNSVRNNYAEPFFLNVRHILEKYECRFDFDAKKENLIKTIEKIKIHSTSLKEDIIEVLKGGCTKTIPIMCNAAYSDLIKEIYYQNPETFIRLIESEAFSAFINQIEGLIKKIIKEKDFCSLVLLGSFILFSTDKLYPYPYIEHEHQIVSMITEFPSLLDFIKHYQLDGIFWFIRHITLLYNIDNPAIKDIKKILHNLAVSKYEALKDIELLKLFQCFNITSVEKVEATYDDVKRFLTFVNGCDKISDLLLNYIYPLLDKEVIDAIFSSCQREDPGSLAAVKYTLGNDNVLLTVEGIKNRIQKYKCLLENENTDFSCLIDNEVIKKAIKEVIKERNVLDNPDKFFKELADKKLIELSPTIKEQCETSMEQLFQLYHNTPVIPCDVMAGMIGTPSLPIETFCPAGDFEGIRVCCQNPTGPECDNYVQIIRRFCTGVNTQFQGINWQEKFQKFLSSYEDSCAKNGLFEPMPRSNFIIDNFTSIMGQMMLDYIKSKLKNLKDLYNNIDRCNF